VVSGSCVLRLDRHVPGYPPVPSSFQALILNPGPGCGQHTAAESTAHLCLRQHHYLFKERDGKEGILKTERKERKTKREIQQIKGTCG
jgi:hypothetical protein